MATFKINDAQPVECKTNISVSVKARIVRSAMRRQLSHAYQNGFIHRTAEIKMVQTANTAHKLNRILLRIPVSTINN